MRTTPPLNNVRNGVMTLSGSAQSLGALISPSETAVLCRHISIQPGPSNSNPVYIGGSGVTSSNGIRLEAPDAGVPPPPYVFEVYATGSADLASFYVIGTENETVRVLWIAYV